MAERSTLALDCDSQRMLAPSVLHNLYSLVRGYLSIVKISNYSVRQLSIIYNLSESKVTLTAQVTL